MKPTISAAKRGILLVGHGTRDPRGVAELFETARQVALARPEIAVEPCFLEIALPSIATAIECLAERGVQQMVVMPLLLFSAGHARRDVPHVVRAAVREMPHLIWTQAGHLGCHAAILEQSAQRFDEALYGQTTVDRVQTALALVGRGSSEARATEEMHRFASLSRQARRVGSTEVCFLAMAEPRLKPTLQALAARRLRRVIVQPHLLFDGLLLADIRSAVAACREQHPETQWLLADRLGPTPLVCDAILERVQQAVLPEAPAGARV